MYSVCTAVRAELLHLQSIRVIAPVLLGDVVAMLTLLAGQGDLGPDVGGLGHDVCLSSFWSATPAGAVW